MQLEYKILKPSLKVHSVIRDCMVMQFPRGTTQERKRRQESLPLGLEQKFSMHSPFERGLFKVHKYWGWGLEGNHRRGGGGGSGPPAAAAGGGGDDVSWQAT